MEESSYKHNYEYLSIEEAKAIINGTFVQDSTSIGGELATKADIDTLLDAANKHMTSIVAGDGNEYVCYFEWASNRVDPTGVHVTNMIIQIGQSQAIQYELTPSNATVDTCVYEITSGSEYVHITDGVAYADAVGEAICKITINGSIVSTFTITATNNNIIDLDCDVIAIQNAGIEVGLYLMTNNQQTGATNVLSWTNGAYVTGCKIDGYSGYWSLVDFDKLRNFYNSVKNTQSQMRGRTVEQMCESPYGAAINILFYDTLSSSTSQEVQPDEKRTYKIMRLKKQSSSASITQKNYSTLYISGYTFEENVSFDATVHAANNYALVDYYLPNRTIIAENYFFVKDNKWSTTNLLVPKDGQFIFRGYQTFPEFIDSAHIAPITPVVDAELLNKSVNGATISGQIKINSIDGKTDISTINGYLNFIYKVDNLASYQYGDNKNGLYNLTMIKELPYTFDFEITRTGSYTSGLFVSPTYIDTSDEELIKVHEFDGINSIVGEIK